MDSSMKQEITDELHTSPIIMHESSDERPDEMSALVQEPEDPLPAPMYPELLTDDDRVRALLRRMRRMNRPIDLGDSPYSWLLLAYVFNFHGQGLIALIPNSYSYSDSGQGRYENIWLGIPWFLFGFFVLEFVGNSLHAHVKWKREKYFSWCKDLEKQSTMLSELFQQDIARKKRIKEAENYSEGTICYCIAFLCFVGTIVAGYHLYADALLMKLIVYRSFLMTIAFGVAGMYSRETDSGRKRRIGVIYSISVASLSSYVVYCYPSVQSWSYTWTFGLLAVTSSITGLSLYRAISSEIDDEK